VQSYMAVQSRSGETRGADSRVLVDVLLNWSTVVQNARMVPRAQLDLLDLFELIPVGIRSSTWYGAHGILLDGLSSYGLAHDRALNWCGVQGILLDDLS
jgi:hypothetical protein